MKKKLISFAGLFLLAVVTYANMPNDKVLKSFKATFSSPQEVKWYEHKDYYEVSFLQAEVRANVKYDLEGNFMSATRYYKEQQLHTHILFKLKKRYPGKKIFGITELTNNEEINYYIKLEDDKNWVTVKVSSNGQMELYEKYRKA